MASPCRPKPRIWSCLARPIPTDPDPGPGDFVWQCQFMADGFRFAGPIGPCFPTERLALVWGDRQLCRHFGSDHGPEPLTAIVTDLLAALRVMVDMFEQTTFGPAGPDDAAARWDTARAAIDRADQALRS